MFFYASQFSTNWLIDSTNWFLSQIVASDKESTIEYQGNLIGQPAYLPKSALTNQLFNNRNNPLSFYFSGAETSVTDHYY